MLSLIPIKDWLYIGAITLLIAFGLYERAHLITEGEAKCLAREKAAADKQAAADTKIAQDTTDELQREISRLRGANTPLQPVTPVRVQCYTRQVPAAAGKPGAAHPGEPATTRGSVSEVPQSTGGGVDVEPSLRRFALAADLVSARDRACLKELREP